MLPFATLRMREPGGGRGHEHETDWPLPKDKVLEIALRGKPEARMRGFLGRYSCWD